MKQHSKYILFSTSIILLLLLLLFSSIPAPVTAQEVEDEREFDYIEGSAKGPKHWGEIKKEWSHCKSGGLQSPIDLSHKRVKMIQKSGEMKTDYKPCNATVMNRGHDIALKWEGNKAGSLMINGTEYFLQQCHWHSPSEHTVNGRRYAMELHMVHQSRDPNAKNNIAVIGLLYKIGQPDQLLSKLLRDIISMSDKKFERSKGVISPGEIKMRGKKYYRYTGSLTVPPCTEGVIWTINKKISTISRDQIKAMREAVHDYAEQNARPVQPLNKRELRLYGPNPQDNNS